MHPSSIGDKDIEVKEEYYNNLDGLYRKNPDYV